MFGNTTGTTTIAGHAYEIAVDGDGIHLYTIVSIDGTVLAAEETK